jgi:hypothetical protein
MYKPEEEYNADNTQGKLSWFSRMMFEMKMELKD